MAGLSPQSDPRASGEGREVFFLNEASKRARMAADARKAGEVEMAEAHEEAAMDMIQKANQRRQPRTNTSIADLLGR